MRIAIFSDIHGNLQALEAVLDDIESRGGADRYLIPGDLVAVGPDPVGVLERLGSLDNALFTRGNTDRLVTTEDRSPPPGEDVHADPKLLDAWRENERSIAWTEEAVAASGRLDWLSRIPLEHREILPDGTRLLAVHASPGTDEGHGLRPHLSADELEQAFSRCDADLVFVGHTHWQMEVVVNGARIVNLGSLSNPQPPDLRASYVILSTVESGYEVEPIRVEYDRAATIRALHDRRHPSADFISAQLRGENFPHWFANGACVIIVDEDVRILMQLRDDKPGMRGSDCWGLFGGFMEPGETPEQTVVRELREELEADLDPSGLELMTVQPTPSGIKSRVFLYRLRGELENALLHEGQRYDFIPEDQVEAGRFQGKSIVPNQLALIEQFWSR